MAKSKIIKELANNSISLGVALNRLFVIASDIENEELQQWAECELHGYGDKKPPAYRYVKNTIFKYSGINGCFQVTNAPLPLQEIMGVDDPTMFYVHLVEGINTIECYLNKPTGNEVGRDLTWAAGTVYKKSGIQCYSIKQIIPLNVFEDVLNSVKMLLMKIFIQLDKTYGCLDDLDIDTDCISPEEIAATNTTINKYIYVDNSINIGDKNKIDGSEILSGGKRDG